MAVNRVEGGRPGTPEWWAAEWEGDSPFYDGPPDEETVKWLFRNALGRRDYDRLNHELEMWKEAQCRERK